MSKYLSSFDKYPRNVPMNRSGQSLTNGRSLAALDAVALTLDDMFSDPDNIFLGSPDTGYAGGPQGVSVHIGGKVQNPPQELITESEED